jgi:hypothetical protein
MKYLFLSLVIILSSCSLIFNDEPDDPGIPSTPITKSIPFTCNGVNYVKMIDSNVLGYGGPFMMMNNDMIYSLDSNKLSILDCNNFKIISSHEIGDRKVCRIGDYAALKNNRFWLFFSTYIPNTSYPDYELLSLIDSTGKAIHTFDFESDFSDALDVKLSPTSSNGCILNFINYDKLYIYNFDENGIILWKKILPCDYNTFYGIRTVVSKIIELKSKNFLYCTRTVDQTYGTDLITTKITKLDMNGDILWVKNLSTGFTDPIDKLIEQSENSYLLSTRKNLIKVDSTGTVISHSESLDNIYSNFLLISDGGIITGYNIVTNGGDIGFSKIRDDGNIEWTKTFGGTGDESLNYIFELNSGGYYLIGTTTNLTGKWKKYLMYKTDFPYKQYYEYDKESVSSYYFIKTDNTGNISNQ